MIIGVKMRDEILLFIKTYLIRKNGSYSTMPYNNKFKSYNKYEYWEYIENHTKFCKSSYEKLYCFIYDLKEPGKCKNCLEYTNFVGKTYQSFCSKRCSGTYIQENMPEQRKLERNEKISKSKPLAVKKAKKTKLERYGDENYNNMSKNIKTRIKNNNGVYWSKEQLDKRYKKLSIKLPQVITIQGVKLNIKKHHKNLPHLNFEYIKDNFVKDDIFLVNKFCEHYNMSYNFAYTIIRRLDINVKSSKTNTENDVYEFINEGEQGNRKFISPLELDILVPDKFAVEYNGLLWHSYNPYEFPTDGKLEDKNKHLIKTELCEEKGIQLFHIFENEWRVLSKREIWKSILNEKLNKSKIIDSKETEIRIVQDDKKDLFLEENHLQGTCLSDINLGLYHKDELVSMMVFDKNELLRFASKLNIKVRGGYKKLLNFYEKNYKPKSLTSYANRRFSDDELYKELGFIYKDYTEPNSFWYNKFNSVLTKEQALENLTDYNGEYSDDENLFINSYRRIYDSGNKIYIKEL